MVGCRLFGPSTSALIPLCNSLKSPAIPFCSRVIILRKHLDIFLVILEITSVCFYPNLPTPVPPLPFIPVIFAPPSDASFLNVCLSGSHHFPNLLCIDWVCCSSFMILASELIVISPSSFSPLAVWSRVSPSPCTPDFPTLHLMVPGLACFASGSDCRRALFPP